MKDNLGNELHERERQIERCLEEVNKSVYENFHKICHFYHFDILCYEENKYHVFILFKKNKELKRYKRNVRLQKELIDFINAQLRKCGLWKAEVPRIEFEMDSDEAIRDPKRRTKNIPTDEELEKINRLDREDWRNLDRVGKNITFRFKSICPFEYFYIMPQGDNEFRAYVFYKTDKDVEECERNGISQAIRDFVYEELERQGRGKRGDIKVVFEFDSDENVKRNYEGNYYLRLL